MYKYLENPTIYKNLCLRLWPVQASYTATKTYISSLSSQSLARFEMYITHESLEANAAHFTFRNKYLTPSYASWPLGRIWFAGSTNPLAPVSRSSMVKV